MTSSSLSGQFRLTLVKLGSLLTKESVQALAFLCDHISRARREELKGALELFDQLQEHDVLNERKVNILIEWLDELRLYQASNLLKEYRQTYLEESSESKEICTEHREHLLFLCKTCNSKLCQKCFLRFHSNTCDVIEIQKNSGKKKISSRRKALLNRHMEVEQNQSKASKGEQEDSCEEVSTDNTFSLPNFRWFVGSVMIRESQLVNVFDERLRGRGVVLTCVDPSNTSIDYWTHPVTVNDNESPVAIAFKEVWQNGINHMLFAVGKTVFIVQPHKTSFLYDSVHSVASLKIDDVGEGSWITSIAVHRIYHDSDQFLISVKGSSVLREYQISGKVLRNIETNHCSDSIISVAYIDNKFAICASCKEVIIITAESTIKQSGFLKPTSFSSGGLPVCTIWTGGAGWMVLFVNDGEEKTWEVVCYQKTGKLGKVCLRGTYCSDNDVPLNISRWGNSGFISFADSSVGVFEY